MLIVVALGMPEPSVTMVLNWLYSFWEAQTNPPNEHRIPSLSADGTKA